MSAITTVALALALDWWLGEPRRAHPLVGFGRLAHWVESGCYGPPDAAPWRRRLGGALSVTVLLSPIAALTVPAVKTPGIGGLLEIVLLYLVLGGKSLAEHARRVGDALDAGALDQARLRVGHMVSRDTHAMSETEVTRATVESVLENGNDAVFGALFWYLIGGAPAALAYRLANTLDAMWGYRNPRYLHFGWAAARLDDLLNLVPARLTAMTYALAGRFTSTLQCWRRQGGAWESPNAGVVMAAGAGALGVQLGGPASYHGVPKHRTVLGIRAAPVAGDIERAVRLAQRGVLLWLGVMAIGSGGWRLA